jgi:hypothetical protein
VEILVEADKLDLVPPNPDAKPEPPARQDVEAGGLLGDQYRCMDNIFVERLWRSLKSEEVYLNAYAMVADWLGVPEDRIRLSQADTDEIAIGRGAYASRSMMIGGSALRAAADEVIERGKRFCGHFMEADSADIAFAEGADPGRDCPRCGAGIPRGHRL